MNFIRTLGGYFKKNPTSDCRESTQSAELSLLPDDRLVVFVQKSNKKCRTAELVIDAVLKLSDIVDDLKCAIICGGKTIQEKTAKANELSGKNMFFAFDDIFPDVFSKGMLFIGEGSAIKEAMLAGKPVIIAGDSGYIGLFDESKKEESTANNFSCKNGVKLDSAMLAQEIGGFFGLWEEEQKKLGEYAHQVITDYNK